MDFKIAYQLYSARDIFDDDMIGVLKKLKEFGYDGVEPAGYYGVDPHYFRGICDATGLKVFSIHLSFWTLTENISDTVRNLKALGCDYAAIPGAFGLFIGEERYPYFVKNFTKLGEALRSEGITLLYHNHGFELENKGGERALEVLYNCFSPDVVSAELDCGFLKYNGCDPAQTIKRYRGRSPVIHLKDFHFNEGVKDDFSTFACPVGEGELDLKSILDAARFAGTKILVVEQDSPSWKGMNEIECAKRSADNLLARIGG